MITPNLNDGEAFVNGRSEETARKLYEAAEKAGIDISLISTASHGYVVPKELVDVTEDVEETKIVQEAPHGVNVALEGNEHVTATGTDDAPGDGGEFNPADHTVVDVKAYYESADDAERERVLAAEKASENPRRGVLNLADDEEGAK